MDNQLIIQYVIVGLIVAFACFSIFKAVKKKFFSNKKGDNNTPQCNKNCGCS